MATAIVTERPMERRASAAPLTTGIFGRRVSWAAVIAGVISATFVELLLGSLGGAIGATTVAAANGGAAKPASIGVGIWMVVSAIISMYAGGWVAGRMSGAPSKMEGAIHGFLTSALGTLFAMFLLASAIGGAFGALSNLAGSGLQAAGSNPNVTSQLPAVVGQVQNKIANAAPQAAANAGQAATTAAKGTAAAGWGVFVLLLLGCGASVAGGAVAAPKVRRIDAGNNPR